MFIRTCKGYFDYRKGFIETDVHSVSDLNMFFMAQAHLPQVRRLSLSQLWKLSVQETQSAFNLICEIYVKLVQFEGVIDGLQQTPQEYG